jgi:hypothetical protein
METKKILDIFSDNNIKKFSLTILLLFFILGFIWGYIYSRNAYGNFSYEPYRTINVYLLLFFICALCLYIINFIARQEHLSGTLLWCYAISPIGFLIGGAISRAFMPLSTIDTIPYLTKMSYHFDTVKVFTPTFLILPALLFVALFIQHYKIKDSDA